MFDPGSIPRVFGMPPGADFPAALVRHLVAAYADQPPEALARVRLIVNTRRMARRIRDLFDAGPPVLLPRIELVTDLGLSHEFADLPPAPPALRRRLELIELISALLEAEPDLAPRAALYDLADSLAAVLGEMEDEGVSFDTLRGLDVTDLSGHWARALKFLTIAGHFEAAAGNSPSPEARQRYVIERLTAAWDETPPDHPVIVAGSTGSRGSTFRLMTAVARLPQGAVVLPGFDPDMPDAIWQTMTDALKYEDHPQFRFARLIHALDLAPGDVRLWPGAAAPVPERNALVSLSLRPAPVTHQWMQEGPRLTALDTAADGMTLIEAASTRKEALTIALRLRQAAEDGQSAALITPDRTLTRQVAAALDTWGILPDDSAGRPLPLTPPGRMLRHVAALFARRLSAEALLTLLKHPLTHSGGPRGPHLFLTRALELHLRRNGPPFPDVADIRRFAATRTEPEAPDWAAWVSDCFCGKEDETAQSLTDRVTVHLALADQIAAGPGGATGGALWDEAAGRKMAEVVSVLRDEAEVGGPISAQDYANLFDGICAGEEVRDPDSGHPGILIWGTLEARVQGTDLVILAGLNEASWPEMPPPDPWLNREMRHRAGLLVPERRIGLSAHDFQQAIGAREVWLTRSIRSDDAETVPSRWLSRLCNLMGGLEGAGARALSDMRERGASWIALTAAFEDVTHDRVPPAPRPAPCPPLAARPAKVSITELEKLVRDPYAIYARRILRLGPLDPLMAQPDPRLRGIVLHEVMETFMRHVRDGSADLNSAALIGVAEACFDASVAWPDIRILWQAQLARIAARFLEVEQSRRDRALPAGFELRLGIDVPGLGVRLTGIADRVDIDPSGNAWIYDYKSSKPPSIKVQKHFNRQLLLSAAVLERGGFEGLGPLRVAGAEFLGLDNGMTVTPAPLDEVTPGQAWEEFVDLIRAYSSEKRGYPSRRWIDSTRTAGDYDHLARFGEWDDTTTPKVEEVS